VDDAAGTRLFNEIADGVMGLDEALAVIQRGLDDLGHDGLVYKNKWEDPGSDSFIATRPGTVKSATTGETLFSNDDSAALPGTILNAVEQGKPLAMDEASRLARAREMGFDTDRTLYHGTVGDFPSFDKSKFGSSTQAQGASQAAWLVDDPRTAAGYADYAAGKPVRDLLAKADTYERLAQKSGASGGGWWDKQDEVLRAAEELESAGLSGQSVMPLMARGNFLERDFGGAEYTDVARDVARLIKEGKAGGYDGLRLLNLADDVATNSRPATHYAVFDPKNIRSVNAAFDPSKSDSAFLLAANDKNAALPGTILNAVEQGKPQRAYHGAKVPYENDVYKPRKSQYNAFFAAEDPAYASKFARNYEGSRVYPVDISPDAKMFDYTNPAHTEKLAKAIEKNPGILQQTYLVSKDSIPKWIREGDAGILEDAGVQRWLRKNGYDGWKFEDTAGIGVNRASFGMLKPGHVRSATTGDLLYGNAPAGAIPAEIMELYESLPERAFAPSDEK
jgi:hypothetical protein